MTPLPTTSQQYLARRLYIFEDFTLLQPSRSQLVTYAVLSNYNGTCDRYKGARSYHEGGPADERMMEVAQKRNIDITSVSRPLKPEDLTSFDVILGMDFQNMADIQVAADYWAEQGQPVPRDYRDKVFTQDSICSFLSNCGASLLHSYEYKTSV